MYLRTGTEVIKKAITDPGTKVVSFDVFDTLILRPFWEPSDLFALLDRDAARMMSACCYVKFSSCRKEAEAEAREEARRSGREDITHKEIYDRIEKTGLFPEKAIRLLMEKEQELELRFCRARKSARELAAFAAAEGKRVVAVSDMYLPSFLIGEILSKNDIPAPERIFVSCEAGLTKRSGHLFEFAAKELGVEKRAIVHIGDNKLSDVKAARKTGIRAFHFDRPAALLQSRRKLISGYPFRRAYGGIGSPLAGNGGKYNLGVRCMLAVAANRLYDNPYRAKPSGKGGYGKDPERFGTVALGMYCMAHALWIDRIAREEKPACVLFFSRDGYLIHQGFEMLQEFRQERTKAVYAGISRKSRFPLLMESRELLITAGTYIGFKNHSPQSLTELLAAVINESQLEALKHEYGNKWEIRFPTETDMLQFLSKLRDRCVDAGKLSDYKNGFLKYFSPFMRSSVITYDVGYNLGSESILKYFYPNTGIIACCTHVAQTDQPRFREILNHIAVRTLYPIAPFVSYAIREIIQSEDAPSCAGYSRDGEPVFDNGHIQQEQIQVIHRFALDYMADFTATFGNDAGELPMDYIAACLPLESYFHSPLRSEKKQIGHIWFEGLYNRSEEQDYLSKQWRRVRLNYWFAKHHIPGCCRYPVLFLVLLVTDHAALKRGMSKVLSVLRRRVRWNK